MNILEVNIQKKTYPSPFASSEDVLAIGKLSFTVPEGEFLCILGPSGSGKTTLLQLITGLDQSVEGTLRIAGKAPAEGAPLGYMFQSPRLLPWLTVLENVELVATNDAKASGYPKLLLEQMELGGFLDTYPNRLSGGMQRRVALARAFVNEPPLLLLDEPFISLDAPVALRLRLILLRLWKELNATIVFVTHDLREAIFLADRILFLSSSPGRIVLDHQVSLQRPRNFEGTEIDDYKQHLLTQYPAVLEGVRAMEAEVNMGEDATNE